jgi:hypothetical protein
MVGAELGCERSSAREYQCERDDESRHGILQEQARAAARAVAISERAAGGSDPENPVPSEPRAARS